MPKRTYRVDRPYLEVWERLQSLDTWEGVAGLNDLHDAVHDGIGDLTSFCFAIETPLGVIRDRADVRTFEARRMHAHAEAKGVEVTIELSLTDMTDAREPSEPSAAVTSTDIEVVLDAQGSSFLTRPLAATLRGVLDANIDREAQRMVDRLKA